MANAPSPREGSVLDLRQVEHSIEKITEIPLSHDAHQPSQGPPSSHKEPNIDSVLDQRLDDLAGAYPSPMDEQSATTTASSTSAGTRPAFSLPSASPARSKRGSPSDMSNDDDKEFRTFFQQKKKKKVQPARLHVLNNRKFLPICCLYNRSLTHRKRIRRSLTQPLQPTDRRSTSPLHNRPYGRPQQVTPYLAFLSLQLPYVSNRYKGSPALSRY